MLDAENRPVGVVVDQDVGGDPAPLLRRRRAALRPGGTAPRDAALGARPADTAARGGRRHAAALAHDAQRRAFAGRRGRPRRGAAIPRPGRCAGPPVSRARTTPCPPPWDRRHRHSRGGTGAMGRNIFAYLSVSAVTGFHPGPGASSASSGPDWVRKNSGSASRDTLVQVPAIAFRQGFQSRACLITAFRSKSL